MNAAIDLAKTKLFSGLDEAQIADFAAIAAEQQFAPQEVVYNEGSAGDSLYIIAEGEFTVRTKDDDGAQVDVATLRAGTYFGEMEVVGGINRTASVVAKGEAKTYRFDAGALNQLLGNKPELAAHIYKQFAKELIKRLRDTTQHMGYFKARAL